MDYFLLAFVGLVLIVSLATHGIFGTLLIMGVGYGIGWYFWGEGAGVIIAGFLVFMSVAGGDSTNFRVRRTNWSPELKKKNGFIEDFDIDIHKK